MLCLVSVTDCFMGVWLAVVSGSIYKIYVCGYF